MPLVRFTRHLQRFFPGLEPTTVEAGTVAEVVDALEQHYPGIRDYIVDDAGALRTHVNIFVGDDRVDDRKTLSDQVDRDDEVHVMQALSGD